MLLPPRIDTERLTLRRPMPKDAMLVADAVDETLDSLARWFSWGQLLQRYADLEDMGARATSGQRRFDEMSDPVLFVWEGTRFLGEVLIKNENWISLRALELQIWIRSSAHGNGFATEALHAVVAHLFEVEGAEILEARIDARNAGSRKLFRRVGFKSYPHFRDHERYVLLSEDWGRGARDLGVVVLTHPECEYHEVRDDQPERPDRLSAVIDAVRDLPITLLGAPRDHDSLRLAHPEAHIEALEALLPDEGVVPVDLNTDVSPDSVYAAMRGVGGAVSGVDLVVDRRADSVFVATRPPGHHAGPESTGGFCLFSTAAIAALHALRVRQLPRVAVVDVDVHHGNGTQEVLEGVTGALFISVHEQLLYPRGPDGAVGNLVNVALPPRSASAAFREAVLTEVIPRLRAFDPVLTVVSMGFDGHHRDPISTMALETSDYAWVTTQLRGVAPVISVLEGGYELVGLALAARAHVDALVQARRPVGPPGFTVSTPIFCVTDLPASLAYYTDVLGFEVRWSWSDDQGFEGGRPTYACVARGDVTLFLGEQRQGIPGGWVHLDLARLDELSTMHRAFFEAGARIAQPPTDQPWGMREMLVEDLDGNTLRIGAHLDA